MHHKKDGYILILSLMIISLAITLVTYIFYIGSVQMPFSYTMIHREKAKQLALSGIQIAIAKLSQEIEIKDEGKKPGQPASPAQPAPAGGENKKAEAWPQEQAAQKLIKEIVPTLNRWQTFALKEEYDGIDGTIKICMGSEDGKIDLNSWYDFEKHAFTGDKAKQEVIKHLIIEFFKRIGKEDLYAEFEKFLKARQYRLDDVTELLRAPGFVAFKDSIFYPGPLKEKEEEKNKIPVYLTDIFTVWSGKQTVDPWLLSHSMCGLLGIKQSTTGDVESRKKAVEQVIKDIKLDAQWATDWKKYLAPLYGTDINALTKNSELIFNTKFEPKIFSVLSYGVVGQVTQKMLAILERNEEKNDKKLAYNIIIKKLYWL
jgi:hypothetical protein